MRNHDQKTRDMARSILPSTARHASRSRKQGSARRARARHRALIGRLMEHLHDLDVFDEALDRYELDDIGWDGLVEDRRSADKVAPLIRWAEVRIERTPHLRDGDYWTRRNHFAGLLGDTVIGRHALQHLDHLFGQENPWAHWSYPGRPTWEEVRQARREAARAEYRERERLLHEVLGGADARRLNARIRALTPRLASRVVVDADGVSTRRWDAVDPWLLDGDPAAWLEVGRKGPSATQSFAFDALAEVHAEMFGGPAAGR